MAELPEDDHDSQLLSEFAMLSKNAPHSIQVGKRD